LPSIKLQLAVIQQFKAEAVWRSTYATRQDARRDVFAFIETFYNRRRIHSAIGYRTPHQMQQTVA